jgi:hypothetical protein
VVARFKGRTGFANRPLALRRCVIEILSRRGRLTARDIAVAAYGRRLVVRPGHCRNVTTAELVATRRALRVLVVKDKVRVLYRFRRWKLFDLVEKCTDD